jgi:hypothetical protein
VTSHKRQPNQEMDKSICHQLYTPSATFLVIEPYQPQ